MKFLYFILLSTLSFPTQSQNIKTSTITWKSASLLNLTTGELAEGAHTLISQNTTSITWTKADNTSTVFTVGEVIGQWNDVKKNGEIVYEVSNSQERGTIIFTKAGTERKIRIVLVTGDGEPVTTELMNAEFEAQ